MKNTVLTATAALVNVKFLNNNNIEQMLHVKQFGRNAKMVNNSARFS